jgi:hypothetical protein
MLTYSVAHNDTASSSSTPTTANRYRTLNRIQASFAIDRPQSQSRLSIPTD